MIARKAPSFASRSLILCTLLLALSFCAVGVAAQGSDEFVSCGGFIKPSPAIQKYVAIFSSSLTERKIFFLSVIPRGTTGDPSILSLNVTKHPLFKTSVLTFLACIASSKNSHFRFTQSPEGIQARCRRFKGGTFIQGWILASR
jgi:hypothetical protein